MSHTLTLTARLDRAHIAPSGGVVQLLIQIGAEAAAAGDRLPLNVAAVVDRSGSMHGPKLDYTKQALAFLVDQVAPALDAAAALDASVADMRFVKPLDIDLLRDLAHRHRLLVTLEENALAGGAGDAVTEALAALGVVIPVLQLGLPDRFIDHGDHARMLADCGLDAAGIVAAVRQRITLLPE